MKIKTPSRALLSPRRRVIVWCPPIVPEVGWNYAHPGSIRGSPKKGLKYLRWDKRCQALDGEAGC